MLTLYGIANCDTIKKARRWLDEHDLAYRFHDYRKDGLDESQLRTWADELGWENLLNRRGTTWRRLSDAEREDLDRDRAVALLLQYPAMIKRPLLDTGAQRLLGFAADRYEQVLLSA
jgi:Spx/MgsR family transcriptional regulator